MGVWSRNRFKDLAEDYGLCENTGRRVVYKKLQQILGMRAAWPMYATHKEDLKFRSDAMRAQLKETQRIVMHDNTNVSWAAPSDANLNRALYSEYYGECCAKGGVAQQLCSWTRAVELMTGGIPDSAYVDMAKLFEDQKKFAERYPDPLVEGGFINIMDKGYPCTLSAMNHGQTCLQPDFAESDRQFSRESTLHSAAVAVVRSSNERAVKLMKHSYLFAHGFALKPRQDPQVVADLWLAWGFQINFMYAPVL